MAVGSTKVIYSSQDKVVHAPFFNKSDPSTLLTHCNSSACYGDAHHLGTTAPSLNSHNHYVPRGIFRLFGTSQPRYRPSRWSRKTATRHGTTTCLSPRRVSIMYRQSRSDLKHRCSAQTFLLCLRTLSLKCFAAEHTHSKGEGNLSSVSRFWQHHREQIQANSSSSYTIYNYNHTS